jgi:poly(3-hydroxybutyrate) depolymerase
MKHLLRLHAIWLGVLVVVTGGAGLRAFAGTLQKDATLVSEGTVRYWDYYVPDGLPPKAPVVFVLHGGGQTKDQILDPLRVSPAKEWLQIADEHKVLINVNAGTAADSALPCSIRPTLVSGRTPRPSLSLREPRTTGMARPALSCARPNR